LSTFRPAPKVNQCREAYHLHEEVTNLKALRVRDGGPPRNGAAAKGEAQS